MAFGARILADSISPDEVRLTSFEVTHPRYILAEVNTHRMLSRNSGSSRAIPVATMLKRLKEDPYTPIYWGSNKRGMQAGEELDEVVQKMCLAEWLLARDDAMRHAERLQQLGLHKQDANRLLEPFMWHTAIITATEWDNVWHLRNHPDAHPAFQTITSMMQELYETQRPEPLDYGDWHLPLIYPEDYDLAMKTRPELTDSKKLMEFFVFISTGRCARTSYLTHDGKRELEADLDLYNKMIEHGHMSPLEHAARPATRDDSERALVRMNDIWSGGIRADWVEPENQWHGNFRGWVQHRKELPWEHDPLNPEARAA